MKQTKIKTITVVKYGPWHTLTINFKILTGPNRASGWSREGLVTVFDCLPEMMTESA